MFVPVHYLPKHKRNGEKPPKLAAVVAVAAGALLTGLISNVTRGQFPHGTGKAWMLGLALGLGAAVSGFVLARRIGHRGKS